MIVDPGQFCDVAELFGQFHPFPSSQIFRAMSDSIYCYHCRLYHPTAEMRQIDTKSGKRWRCIKSIEAAKGNRRKRDAYGKQVTDANRAETVARNRLNREIGG